METPSIEKLQQIVAEVVKHTLQEKKQTMQKAVVQRQIEGKPLADDHVKKPEYMTHLNGEALVKKNHPRIALRGRLDSLEAEIILLQTREEVRRLPALYQDLEEIIRVIRKLIRCEVTGEPVGKITLQGLQEEELREHSHHPSKYYGRKHFLPNAEHGAIVAALNRLRTLARETELAAYRAFESKYDVVEPGNHVSEPEHVLLEREDILKVLNRLSSLFWIMMFKYLAGAYGQGEAAHMGAGREIYVEVEASGRHVHLSRKDVEALFGAGYQLTKVRDLSQPGQYVCKERISITGPKGTIENVVVLGPERKETQVEVSFTDGLTLGIRPPVRQSGDIRETPGAILSHGSRQIALTQGVIVAKRHIHISSEDAVRWQIQDNELLDIEVLGSRPVIFKDTVARVSRDYATYVHIDYDEANACGFEKGIKCRILGKADTKQKRLNRRNVNASQSLEDCGAKIQLADFTGNRILQENQVMQVRGKGYTGILIGKETILTPLALDYIKNHEMQIRYS